MLTRHATASIPHVSAGIAVGSVSLKRLTTAALMMRPESIRSAARLTNGEVWCRTRRRWLTFRPRQLCANQWPMNRSVFKWLGRLFLAAILVDDGTVVVATRLCFRTRLSGLDDDGLIAVAGFRHRRRVHFFRVAHQQ